MLATVEIIKEGSSYTGRCWAEKIASNLSVNREGGIWHERDGAGGEVIRRFARWPNDLVVPI
jgi:hypothetical protein